MKTINILNFQQAAPKAALWQARKPKVFFLLLRKDGITTFKNEVAKVMGQAYYFIKKLIC